VPLAAGEIRFGAAPGRRRVQPLGKVPGAAAALRGKVGSYVVERAVSPEALAGPDTPARSLLGKRR
jgi:hypothetical protein